MRVVVVHESMFGNTRQIATAIAAGLEENADVTVVGVADVQPADVAGCDLVVVGGPTHAHGMTRTSTRAEAARRAREPRRDLVLEPGAPGRGVREWAEDPATVLAPLYAAFATRSDVPVLFGGNAAGQIDRALRRRGSHRVVGGESFFVTKDDRLRPGETARAREWGRALGSAASAGAPGTRPERTSRA